MRNWVTTSFKNRKSKYRPGNYIGEDKCFFIQYMKGASAKNTGNIYYNGNKIIVEDIIESGYSNGTLTFDGRTVKIHELSAIVEGIQPTNHYYSRGVGLIRKELLDSNQVWNLVNYHIEQ